MFVWPYGQNYLIFASKKKRMGYILLAIVAILLLTLIFTLLFKKNNEVPPAEIISEECCGAHEICEDDRLVVSNDTIEYYNDEELDRFTKYPEINYSLNDIEEFRNVLLTLQEKEVAGWIRSIQLRQINLPIEIREEALLIVSERRYKA